MTSPEEEPEEAKKITIRPRQFQPPPTLDPVLPAQEPPAPVRHEPEEEALPKPSRKRPSPTLRSADPMDAPPLAEGRRGDADSSPAAAGAAPGSQENRRPSRGKRSKGGLGTPIPLGVALALCILLTVLAGFFFYSAGTRAGFEEAESAAVKEDVELTPEFLARLNKALDLLQKNDAVAALEELRALEAEQPDVATLSLLMANAALLADKSSEANEHISESIRRRESVSDALTLQAIVEAKLATDSSYKKMGSPKVRIEQLLRQAIAADASNARPYFELATLKRFEQKHDEALELLRSAQCRLQAADSRAVTDTAITLTEMQRLPDSDLKPLDNPRPVPEEIFAAAYAAMRLGDFAKASTLLETARGFFPAPLFRQILKDPAFLPYNQEPALADFFKSTAQPTKK